MKLYICDGDNASPSHSILCQVPINDIAGLNDGQDLAILKGKVTGLLPRETLDGSAFSERRNRSFLFAVMAASAPVLGHVD